MKKINACLWCYGVFFIFTFQSCQIEDLEKKEPELNTVYSSKVILSDKNSFFNSANPDLYTLSEIYFDARTINSSCPSTDFSEVISEQFEILLQDPYFDFDLVNYISELNRKYVTYYEGENFYGENGEYDQLAKKRMRELQRFWKLDRDISLNGQHTSLLTNREILTDMIESFDRTVRNRTQAYEKADMLLEIYSNSPNFPENPLFAFDSFTRSNGLLVIGDGLLEILEELGIDGEIAFTAILSHEWWHQAQFENSEDWTYLEEIVGTNEKSRFTELEADFAAAYFMAHKRGATYNWWRIEEYFTLSFNVGDCLTSSDQHHGTPAQRLAAAKLGYQLAESAKKKGFILSPDEVHQAFLDIYETMIL